MATLSPSIAGSTVPHRYILGMRVDATSYDHASEQIISWGLRRESRYVCVATVHMVMETYDSPAFRSVVNGADLVTPDGMPLVWLLRARGIPTQQRVYGPDLMLEVCRRAAGTAARIGLYGGRPELLPKLVQVLQQKFPGLNIAYAYSPPFRPLTPAEDSEITRQINSAGVNILFVGLGCPKQETWMAAHRGRIHSAMVGVGAAFDFHTGRVRQAPRWVQNAGLEWLFRLLMEPRRLWRRYLIHNPRFMCLVLLESLRLKRIAT